MVRTPEVHNFAGEDARSRIDGQDARISGHQHGYSTCALGWLRSGVQVIAGNVGGDNDDLFLRIAGHQSARKLQRRGTRVASLLQLNRARVRVKTNQLVDIDGSGLRLVDTGLSGEHDGAHAVDTVAIHNLLHRSRGHRHRIFIRGNHAGAFLPQALVIFCRFRSESGRNIGEVNAVRTRRKSDVINTDRGHIACCHQNRAFTTSTDFKK